MTEIYQLHLWLRKISPMISRRFLVRDDTSIADLHQIIQVSMGWSGTHLHKFSIQGKGDHPKVWGGLLKRCFEKWYPRMDKEDVPVSIAA